MVDKYFICGIINVVYNDGEFKGSVLIRNDDGIIPIELNNEELLFISFYKNIWNELINGKKLYIDGFNGYIGIDMMNGPYAEDKCFMADYSSSSNDLHELLNNLDKCIENENRGPVRINKLY